MLSLKNNDPANAGLEVAKAVSFPLALKLKYLN
jgi:hypothetical protein